ncbi:hypothetical protein F2Q69_00000927 [Brassica cretica]|uniref:Uncharacterized protein n=1 Tax=Brassica cretica TaxID=69181 RepID=A0A8S9PIX2_BRACR|nr:hypothetical protein F2Q69_00000927 [Brassica cretica]
METLSIPASAWFSGGAIPIPNARLSPPYLLRKPPGRNSRRLAAFNAASRSVSELVGEDVLQMFLKDREENGDFISKVSDMLWLREVLESIDLNSNGGSSAIGLEDNQSLVSHLLEPIIGSAIGSGIDGGADGDRTFVTVITHVLPDRLCSVIFTLNLCVYSMVLNRACGTDTSKPSSLFPLS